MNVQGDRFCSNCGTALAPSDRFCESCGAAIAPAAPQAPVDVAPGPSAILPDAAASRSWVVWVAVGAGAVLLIAIAAFALGRRQTPSAPVTPVARESPTAAPSDELSDAFADVYPSEEPPSPSPSPQPPVATREIHSSIGTLLIQKAQLTNQYSVCPAGGGKCSQAPENQYVLILTVKSAEGRSGEQFSTDLSPASIESYIMSAQGMRADPDHTTRGAGGSGEIWYAHFDSKSQGELILYWPDNPPIILPL